MFKSIANCTATDTTAIACCYGSTAQTLDNYDNTLARWFYRE
jgi:hypothetical protein